MAPTLEDVAGRAGVSRGTASRALTGHPHVAPATRERVLAAAAELGYRPDLAARSLAGGPGDRVAVVSLVHPWSPAEDPFLAAVTAGAAEAAAATGVGVLLRRLPVGDRARRGWSVPGDVEVVSFDDFPAPAGSRGYTSLSSVTPQLGATAVRMVVAGPQAGDHRRLPVELLS